MCLAFYMKIIRISVVFCIVFIATDCFSQQIQFRHLTINDGLSQNAIFAIEQNSKGFMWFGTKDGLNRFDGRDFVVYQHNPFDTTTVSDNFITEIYEDSRGLVWIGTLSGGVNIFDPESEQFTRMSFKSAAGEILTNEVTSITEAFNGEIWVGTRGGGLIRIANNPGKHSNFTYRQFLHDPENSESLSHNVITDLLFDSYGTFWIGTNKGLNRYDINTGLFDFFDFETKNPNAPANSLDKRIGSLFENQNGTLWLGTQNGLIMFNRNKGDYKHFPNKYDVFRYGWGSVNHIAEDQSGVLWLGTAAGLMRFDTIKKSYSYYQNEPYNASSISFNIISSLFTDRTGILWIGTSGHGINIYDPKTNRFPLLKRKSDSHSRITGFSVRSILEDKEGFVWISADVLYRWNRKTGELKSFETSSNHYDDFGNTNVYSMIQSSDGAIWVASERGLFKYDPETGNSKLFDHKSPDSTAIFYSEVNAVFEDRNGSIWTANKNYFCKLIDPENGIFQHFRHQTTQSLKDMSPPIIYQDSAGIYWIGTTNGLIRFDYESKSFFSYRNNPARLSSLSNNLIKSIAADPLNPEEYLWIGTSGGLNKFNFKNGLFEHYTEKNGLPNNVVYGILPDDSGNLWLSTNNGLSKFNPQNKTFRNYDVLDGLQSNEFNTGAYFRSKNGELFFGGIEGLNYFKPDSIIENRHVPPVVLTGLRIQDRLISAKTDQNVLQKPIHETEKIVITYYDNVISIDFAALDYSAPEKNQYAYMLDNFNKEWIYSGVVSTATYTNLPPGEYTFRVKACNNDGIWNDEGITLALIVTPPWWRTWWAYLLFAFMFLNVLYLLRRYELNRFNLKNQLAFEKIETDSLRKLDHLKSHFFANISHEFRTPLTLILGQIENLQASNVNRRFKEKLNIADRNARRLLSLINQLLELSKLEAGKIELKTDIHNIVSFLKSLFYSFETLADSKNITLSFHSDFKSLPVQFDTDKMEKVFYNLLTNAFKFTGYGGSIKLSITKPDGDTIKISVKDTGIGIASDRLPHIFDRFYQADTSAVREYEGTGIGLALVQEYLNLHKGKISVFSRLDDGSEFIVHLPSIDAPVDTLRLSVNRIKPNHSNGLGDPEWVAHKSERDSLSLDTVNEEIILIVDDNTDVRTFIREQLENDYRILETNNGKEGLAVSQNQIPDLIISDLMMPEMDGYTFCRKIRNNEKTSHIPIIMLTAKAGLRHKIEGLETGIDAYLTKPFRVKELKVRVGTLIQRRKDLQKRFAVLTLIKPAEVTSVHVDQTFLDKTIKIIEKHIDNDQFSIKFLADSLNMSPSQLNRKLNALIGQSAGKLIQSHRLHRASEILKNSDLTIAEISYKVGYSDQAYFSRTFKKQFGKSPSKYRK